MADSASRAAGHLAGLLKAPAPRVCFLPFFYAWDTKSVEICRFVALERYALYNAVAANAHLLILTFRDKRNGAGGERGHGFRP
jgi:hypothetical protein